MKTPKEIATEFIAWKREHDKKTRNEIYFATGLYYLNRIDETEFNYLVLSVSAEQARECASKLNDLVTQIEDPLALWCVQNLPLHQALYVIKHLPLYLDQMDELAAKTKWCYDVYQMHRANAIKSGALLERPDK
jgi:hypothetical protein